jgi:protease-4
MNKKQILGLVIAGLVFVFVCSSSILMGILKERTEQASSKKAAEMLESWMDGSIELPSEDYIGVIRVEGTITATETDSLFGTVGYDHDKTLNLIEQYMDSYYNKGILLYVDSPGGYVYETDELYLKLKEYKEVTGRPIYAYMASQACSGGYYITMAADKIYENRNGMTGSIGVISSLLNMEGLYEKLGIEEINITSGENKAMGSSGSELTQEQRDILQSMVDEAFDQFVEIVADGRNMGEEKVREIADGRIYTPKQALELGMIDGIASYEETVEMMQVELNGEYTIFEPIEEVSFFSSLFTKAKELKSRSDAEVISELLEKRGNGGIMYYANTGR